MSKTVVHFERARTGGMSIERLFEVVRDALAPSVDVARAVCPEPSSGFGAVFRNGLWASKHQGQVNHVVGDVHYLVPFLRWSKTVLTVHDLRYLDEEPRLLKKLVLLVLWTWLPVTLARTVTVISPFTRERLLRYVPWARTKVKIVPNCVTALPRRRGPIAGPIERPTLLHLGVTPNKNLEATVQALEGYSCRLLIVGRVSEEQRALLAASSVEHQLYADVSHQEMLRIYEQVDALLFLSRYEGFGLPILEAQAAAVPVFTSDLEVTRFVGGKGCTYLALPPQGPLLKTALDGVLKDPLRFAEMQRLGEENVARFSARAVAADYERVYREVLTA